jgi:hypothetical protein
MIRKTSAGPAVALGAVLILATVLGAGAPAARENPWSARMADSVMARHPDPLTLDTDGPPRWNYTQGLVLKAILAVAVHPRESRDRSRGALR